MIDLKNTDLTRGKVTTVLRNLALPIMASSLLQFTYNLIDMLLVGRLGSGAVASIGSSSFFIVMGNSINSIVTIGTGIKVAHSIGQHDTKKVKEYTNAGLAINVFLAVSYCLILIVAGRALIGILDMDDPEVEMNAYNYLALNGPVLLFSFFNILYTRLLGSYGNNKFAFKINAVGVAVNAVMDPLFIYGLDLGVIGAALGTLAANAVMFTLFLLYSGSSFRYHRDYGLDFKKIREIAILGLPTASQRILFTVINISLAKIIAAFGPEAIAAQKIGLQIESVTYMVIAGINGAMASFTGQNFGAKEYSRIKSGYFSALKIGIGYSALTAALLLLFNVPIVEVFIREPYTVSITASYLTVIAYSQIFGSVEMISNGLFTGLGKPYVSSAISIFFTALRIPAALVLTNIFGLKGVWVSISASSILKGISALIAYKIIGSKDLD